MQIDKFTVKLREALEDAQSVALGNDNQYLAPVHLTLAMLRQEGSSVRAILLQLDVDVSLLERELEVLIDRLPKIKESTENVRLSPELVRVLNLAGKYAFQDGDDFVSSEIVLLALLEGEEQSILS